MPLTPIEVDLVENLAQEQVRYETIHKDQRNILKTNQNEFDQARARLEQSSAVVKPGQRWQPAHDQVDQYLAQCDATCRSIPHNFDELSDESGKLLSLIYSNNTQSRQNYVLSSYRSCVHYNVQIFTTTFRGSACDSKEAQRVTVVIQLNNCVRSPDSLIIYRLSRPRRPPPSPITNEALLSKRSVEPRRITSEDFCLFQNPEELHGKQFILSPNSVDSEIFEIIGYSRKRDKTVTFDLLFDDGCEDPVPVDAEELMGLLKSSLYFPG